MDLVLGIDTGGTFTDGVLLNYETKEVVATTKALTTRYDLTVGILNAIDALLISDPAAVKLVSISTTLATNAIAEGKGKRVALLLIGYDPELVRAYDLAQRFATSHYFYIRGGHDLFGQEREPLDVEAIEKIAREVAPEVDAFAVSAYFSPLNPDHEERAYGAVTAASDLPVVLAHHLSTKLNSIERATTASLNASLVVILRDFIAAVRAAMHARGIDAPLMIVRGDGTLMSAEIADRHAVETIHSGPAASAMGGHFLSGCDPALVIDIGGTTTDIAVVDAGQVKINEEGTTVGGYRTAVKAANIRSFGLGGDSWITLDKAEQLKIGPTRVVPLAHLAAEYPRVHDQVVGLLRKRATESLFDELEYWFLQRAGANATNDPKVEELFDLLREGPRPLPALLKALKLQHPMQFSGYHLIERELIGRAALTPTDLLHARGIYAPWDSEAACAAVEIAARLRRMSVEEFSEQVFGAMTDSMLAEVVQFLSERELAARDLFAHRRDLGLWFFENSIHPRDRYLKTTIKLAMPIIGIGAPAGIFLPHVAEVLQTELVLPPHYAVANAVGAVAGSVVATCEAIIYARLRDLNPVGYIAQVGETHTAFPRLEPALEFARAEAKRQAEAEALRAGAVAPHTHVQDVPNGVDSYRIRARAVGNPRLEGRA
jgi:N-methylhydantoinase A/oxoprolinase/acetone carboxylase beta subunit